jgi:hypothetical protein
MKVNVCWLLVLLSGCSCHHNSTSYSGHECTVDSRTPFGQKLLTNAQRLTSGTGVRVIGDCREVDELNTGNRNTLTSWKYDIPIEQAKKLALEDLQLDQTH